MSFLNSREIGISLCKTSCLLFYVLRVIKKYTRAFVFISTAFFENNYSSRGRFSQRSHIAHVFYRHVSSEI